MTTKRAVYPVASVKADGDQGRVEAIVSVFGNVDKQGDRIVKGAFRKSIADWKASGDPVPVVFSHDWGDLFSHIGVVDTMVETDKGLKVDYTLDIADNPAAAQAFKLLKRRSLKEHSFAFEILPGGERRSEDGANELTRLSIIEVGPTLKGANPDTEVLGVKSALEEATVKHDAEVEAKAGARFSRADRKEIEDTIAELETAHLSAISRIRALIDDDDKNDEPQPKEAALDSESPDTDREPLAKLETEHPEKHEADDQKLLAASIDNELLELERIKAMRI